MTHNYMISIEKDELESFKSNASIEVFKSESGPKAKSGKKVPSGVWSKVFETRMIAYEKVNVKLTGKMEVNVEIMSFKSFLTIFLSKDVLCDYTIPQVAVT